MPTPPRRRPPTGLTTIEVVVAMTLLAVGIVTTLAVQAALTGMAARAQARRAIAVYATNLLDSLRASPCATVTGGSSTSASATLTWTATRAVATVTVQLTVTPTGAPPWHAATILPCP